MIITSTLKTMKYLSLILLPYVCVLTGCQDQKAGGTAERSMVVAHRGASHYAPENTVAAAELAWEQNADAVEIDIHLSSDGRLVVMHDKDSERTTGKKFIISQTPYDSLKTLEAGGFKAEKFKGEPIPLLQDIVETLPERKVLFVEIKSNEETVPVILEKFGDHPKADQFVFIAFDYETIKAAKKAFPDNEAYWLASRFKEDVKTVLQKVQDDGLDGVDLKYTLITPDVMTAAEALGLDVHAWTVNDPQTAKELQSMGVRGITTDIPDKILSALAAPAEKVAVH